MNERPIDRIHQFVMDSLVIRRVEYRIAEIPIFLIPLLVEAKGALPRQIVIEGFFIFGFMLAFGDIVNCWYDRDLDAKHKPNLSNAIARLGRGGVMAQLWFSGIGALAVAAHLAWLLSRPLLLPAVAVGLGVAWIYSAPPIRMKGQGALQLLWYWGGLFFGPMLFASMLMRDWPSDQLLLIAAAFATVQTGIVLVNNAEDYPEDKAAGVRTATVALGLRMAMQLAAAMTFLGWLSLCGAFVYAYLTRVVPLSTWPGIWPLVCAGAFASGSLYRIAANLIMVSEERAVDVVREAAQRVPLWITGVAVTALVAAFTLWKG